MGPWLVDVAQRSDLDPWLEGTAPVPYRPVVLLVRGDDDVIRELLPNALDAAKQHAHRVVVWVKAPELLEDDETAAFFRGEASIVAAALSADHRVRAWMTSDRIGVDDAAFAFARAESA
jgi:hypothetical protein